MGQAQADLFGGRAELSRQRFRELVRHHVQCGQQAVPGLQRGANEIQCVRQLLAEQAHTLVAFSLHDQQGNRSGRKRHPDVQEQVGAQQSADQSGGAGEQRHIEQHLTRPITETRLLDRFHQPRCDGNTGEYHV